MNHRTRIRALRSYVNRKYFRDLLVGVCCWAFDWVWSQLNASHWAFVGYIWFGCGTTSHRYMWLWCWWSWSSSSWFDIHYIEWCVLKRTHHLIEVDAYFVSFDGVRDTRSSYLSQGRALRAQYSFVSSLREVLWDLPSFGYSLVMRTLRVLQKKS